jgi:hypothetical protein
VLLHARTFEANRATPKKRGGNLLTPCESFNPPSLTPSPKKEKEEIEGDRPLESLSFFKVKGW